jgi:Lar family restriction alleviation protein
MSTLDKKEITNQLDILPCPFCGSTAKLDHLVGADDYFVSCTGCEIQQIAKYNDYDAIYEWNRREWPVKKRMCPACFQTYEIREGHACPERKVFIPRT